MSKLKNPSKSAKLKFPLEPNDLIEIIAPGSGAPMENLIKGAEVLRSWGLRVQYDSNILNPELYLANNDQYRFESFKKALLNPEVKALWCLRGGYGAIRLAPYIQKMSVPKKKKLLIGFSDVTSLHAILNTKWKWPSLHASLIDRLASGKLSEENLRDLKSSVFNLDHKIIFDHLVPINKAAEKKQIVKAQIVGGTLMVVASGLGTPSRLKARNKILFFEEIGERAYRVDRCLHQLMQAGMFEGVKAVVFGDFFNCLEADGKDLIPQTLNNFFKDLKIPAFKGLQVGHAEIQLPLYFNTPSVLTCGSLPQLINYGPS